jgi:hypothetical protein
MLVTAGASGVGDRPMTDLIDDALREALAEGETSGPAEPFDFDAFLADRRAPNGRP